MMPENVCDLCYKPQERSSTVRMKVDEPTEVEMLRIRVSALEKTVHELLDKIAAIANWCYREK